MAKDDPLAKARKAQKAKDKKRNKESREKARDAKAVKSDSRGLEASLRRLEGSERAGTLSEGDKTELDRLRKESEHVKKAKAEYVAAHPDQHNQVYHIKQKSKASSSKGKGVAHLFGKNGLPRRPERSIHYHPEYNPTGMPPPGQAYQERPATPDAEEESVQMPSGGEGDSDEEGSDRTDSDEEDDDDIIMPEGPPPGAAQSDSDEDSDGIVMPDGPPPPRPGQVPTQPPPAASSSSSSVIASGPVSYSAPSQPAPSTSADPTASSQPFAVPAAAPVAAQPPKPASSSVISAAPQLRDLRQEATTFVPAALKRKRAQAQQQQQETAGATPGSTLGSLRPVQAAPDLGDGQVGGMKNPLSSKRARVEDADEEDGPGYEPLEGFEE